MSDAPNRNKLASPLSIRFTEDEKARLRVLAGSKPLGRIDIQDSQAV